MQHQLESNELEEYSKPHNLLGLLEELLGLLEELVGLLGLLELLDSLEWLLHQLESNELEECSKPHNSNGKFVFCNQQHE